jgi:Fe-S cluster biogenesis protein NfuA
MLFEKQVRVFYPVSIIHIGSAGLGKLILALTLKMGVERYLKDACPEVTEVVQEQ